MNSTNMIGRLTADPELRRTPDGTAVCTFTLAVRRPRVKDTSDFIDFVAWRQSAEYLSQYGHKGDIVAVSGPLTQLRQCPQVMWPSPLTRWPTCRPVTPSPS